MLSKETQDQIRKEAKDYVAGFEGGTATKNERLEAKLAYLKAAETWAVWKEKALEYEKALKEIAGRSVCYNAIAIATNTLEQGAKMNKEDFNDIANGRD